MSKTPSQIAAYLPLDNWKLDYGSDGDKWVMKAELNDELDYKLEYDGDLYTASCVFKSGSVVHSMSSKGAPGNLVREMKCFAHNNLNALADDVYDSIDDAFQEI